MMLFAAACGGSKEGSKEDAPATEAPDKESTDTEKTDTEGSEDQTESEKATESAALPGEFDKSGKIEKTVLIDEMDVKVTATEISYGNSRAELKLTLENNSSEDLTFIAGSMGYSANSVNGYMISDGFFNETVNAGKKANETAYFDYDLLQLMGINSIAEMELGIYIDNKDYDTILTKNCVLRTNLYDSYDFDKDTFPDAINSSELKNLLSYSIETFGPDDQYDKGGVKMLSSGIIKNTDGEYSLICEMVNTTDKQLVISASDFALNGLTVSSGTWSHERINAGKRAVLTYELDSMISEEERKIFGIDDIGAVDFTLELQDEDNNDIEDEQTISVSTGKDSSPDTDGAEWYNENGIRIISKGLSDADYGNDIHFYVLIENNSGKTISIDSAYDSESINGYMTEAIMYSVSIPDGKYAMGDIEFMSSSLEENSISGIDYVEDIELTFEIRDDNYSKIYEPKVTATFKE